tara:strand:- start:12367 stop:13434 length:1068 start_codon:yes stop_codon:yes gene_type:complete
MWFYSERKDLVDYFKYIRILAKAYFIPIKDKVIYIEISNVEINRYLAALLIMLDIQGYTIYIPKDKKLIKILDKSKGEFRYTSWLLSDKIIKFGNPPKNLKRGVSISANQLSNNYFSAVNLNSFYHIPMCCYPAFYKNYNLFKKINSFYDKRKRCVFMAGNFDGEFYRRIDESSYFNQPSRKKVVDYIKEKEYYYPIKSIAHLNNYISGEKDNNVILINTKEEFRIPFTSLFEYLVNFDFFLALPGVTIPQSHNLIEAMACGCIPIIHQEYAALMQPPLEHNKNAFLFADLDDLHELLLGIFEISNEFIREISENVNLYYYSFLTPEAIVKEVIKPSLDCIYIQAEHKSLKLLNS